MPGIRWISSMDVHPSGDHIIVGGYDRKLCWFDLELSDKPYKILRYEFLPFSSYSDHTLNCNPYYRQVSFPRYPLRPLPSHLPPLCLLVRRRFDTDLPCAGIQRPHDGSFDCALENSERSRGEGEPGCSADQVGSETALADQCGSGQSGRCMV